ncbi:outer membrane protein assembly factor BamD [Blattabacterium cuenoti]|uniref:outer membrane protein assembly factor BamD n=1 Tax=Blattabacterium cuenoti TaxID=1653831 RepID=UPI00163CE80D|nr:outer membrane protein assembly factor BamD [Blattabacterium cuenoti]
MNNKVIFLSLFMIIFSCYKDQHVSKNFDNHIFPSFFHRNPSNPFFSKNEISILKNIFKNWNFFSKKDLSNSNGYNSEENRLFKHGFNEFINSLNFDLDQTKTRAAVDTLNEFITKYPNSQKIQEIRNILVKLIKRLEKRDYYIANTYFFMHKYKASLIYFKDFIKKYPKSIYKENALYKICIITYKMADNREKASDFFDAYQRYIKLYPDSSFKIRKLNIFYKKLLKL